jgi:hypothetical protein
MSNNNEELLPLLGIIGLGVACFYVCCKKKKSLKDNINNVNNVNVNRVEIINEEVELLVTPQVVNELPLFSINKTNYNVNVPPYKISDDPPAYQV